MKNKLFYTIGLIVLSMVAFVTSPAEAQTVAPGPYYATPSWDQTLPSSTRFIVLSNFGSAAVLDRETGLVWERSPGTRTFLWGDAQRYCNDLTCGNRKGWKLPAVQELASLVDPSVPYPGPTLPAGHPFNNVQSQCYWSANTSYWRIGMAQAVCFNDGFVAGSAEKLQDLFVWCVRGGQGVDPQ
jgi:hypothetical protein